MIYLGHFKKYGIIAVFLIWSCFFHANLAQAQSPQEDTVEIYIKGKKFNSFEEYRKYKLKKVKEGAATLRLEGDSGVSHASQIEIFEDGTVVGQKDKQKKEVYSEESSTDISGEDLLDQLIKEGALPVNYDVSNMKTIVISPEEDVKLPDELPETHTDAVKAPPRKQIDNLEAEFLQSIMQFPQKEEKSIPNNDKVKADYSKIRGLHKDSNEGLILIPDVNEMEFIEQIKEYHKDRFGVIDSTLEAVAFKEKNVNEIKGEDIKKGLELLQNQQQSQKEDQDQDQKQDQEEDLATKEYKRSDFQGIKRILQGPLKELETSFPFILDPIKVKSTSKFFAENKRYTQEVKAPEIQTDSKNKIVNVEGGNVSIKKMQKINKHRQPIAVRYSNKGNVIQIPGTPPPIIIDRNVSHSESSANPAYLNFKDMLGL